MPTSYRDHVVHVVYSLYIRNRRPTHYRYKANSKVSTIQAQAIMMIYQSITVHHEESFVDWHHHVRMMNIIVQVG
jgi:hypothetical protein